MNLKDLKDLIDFLLQRDIAEFELEHGEVKLRLKRTAAFQTPAPPTSEAAPLAVPGSPPRLQMAVSSPEATAAATATPEAEEAGMHIVRSPMVGTFYEAPSPGTPPCVKIGDTVNVGQLLCIVEAMKLMNEIESDAAGVIVKRYVENAQAVEYGQPLFAIRASRS